MDREQVGGDHYRTPPGIPEHWDLAVELGWDFFQYQITKYLWRWKDKGGVQDLRKAEHFLRKYIAVLEANPKLPARFEFPNNRELGAEPGPGYVNQDPDISPRAGRRAPASADSPAVESASPGTTTFVLPNYIYLMGMDGKPVEYERVK